VNGTPADGSAYWNRGDRIRELLRAGETAEAERILLECVEATEREGAVVLPGFRKPLGVAPAYYERLAILYAKQKRYADELAILERYAEQPKAPGVGPKKLKARLAKARARMAKK